MKKNNHKHYKAMRRVLFLCILASAMLIVAILTSCNLFHNTPTKKMEALADKVSAESDKWSDDEWDKMVIEFLDIYSEFAESDPSEEDYVEFNDAVQKVEDSFRHISRQSILDRAEKAFKRVSSNYSKIKAEDLYNNYGKIYKKYGDYNDVSVRWLRSFHLL